MDQLRIGDADRETAVTALGEQYAHGRISKDELDERSDAVWSARTHGDLAPLFADLPVEPSGQLRVPGRAQAGMPFAGRGGRTPARTGWHGAGRYVAPVVFILVALTILTHLPFFLVALGLFWLVRHRCAARRATPCPEPSSRSVGPGWR